MTSQKGFTLIELMIAIAVIAILTAIAIPSYEAYVQRSARANLEADLMTAASAMERLKAQNFSYTGAKPGTAASDTFSSVSPAGAAAGKQKYNLTLVGVKADGSTDATNPLIAGLAGYEIIAVSTSTFASGGKTEALKINHLGQKCYKKLGTSISNCIIGTATPDPSWP